MALRRIRTADKRIQRIEPMHQASIDQEVQSAVHLGRGRGASLLVQDFKDVVGTDRFVAIPDQFQYTTPNRRKTQTALIA